MEFINTDSAFFSFGIGAGILWYIFLTFCLYKIAKKMGRNDAWNAFIPILNIFYVMDLAGYGLTGCLFLIIPILNIFVYISAWSEICKKLNKSPWLALLMLFPPTSIILTAYLAFFD